MKTKNVKMLPKTADQISNGGIYSQRVRCGKSNCRCSKGYFHEAFYFFTRLHGKLLKFYIRTAELNQFSAMVAKATSARKQSGRILRENGEMLRGFRQQLREIPKQ
jgi:hypothetical protein